MANAPLGVSRRHHASTHTARQTSSHVPARNSGVGLRSEEHTSELQSQSNLVCRLLLEKKNIQNYSARKLLPNKSIDLDVMYTASSTDPYAALDAFARAAADETYPCKLPQDALKYISHT